MTLTIGKLAAAAGVNPQTIRYYERTGLLARPARTPGGYRQYGPDEIKRLRFIRRAQRLGFSLDEVGELLGLRVHDPHSCGTVERRVKDKMEVTEARIRELQGLLKVLRRLHDACDARQRTSDCPILEALTGDA